MRNALSIFPLLASFRENLLQSLKMRIDSLAEPDKEALENCPKNDCGRHCKRQQHNAKHDISHFIWRALELLWLCMPVSGGNAIEHV